MNDQIEITDAQRRRLVGILLQAARDLNEGHPPGAVLRPMLDAIRGTAQAPATSSTQVVLHPEVVPTQPAQSPRRANPHREAIERIFDHWRRQLDHPQARLTPERATKIQARLRDGYTEEDVLAAIDGCANSPFHRGENEQATRYDDLTMICRSGSVLEKFRDLAGHVAPATTVAPLPVDEVAQAEAREIRRLEFEAKALLKSGNVEAYNDAVRSIRERKARTHASR